MSTWKKVGTAPLTQNCLEDKSVRRELGDNADDTNDLMAATQEANDTSCALLTLHGYAVETLQAQIKRVPKARPITAPHSLERIILLSKAKSHGEKFTATGGSHLTSDDFFKSMEVPVREKEVKELEQDKVRQMNCATNEQLAMQLLCGNTKVLGTTPTYLSRDTFTADNLDLLLKWYQVPQKEIDTKAKKWAKWKSILEHHSPPIL